MLKKSPPQFNQPNLDQDNFDRAWQAKSPQEKEAVLEATAELARRTLSPNPMQEVEDGIEEWGRQNFPAMAPQGSPAPSTSAASTTPRPDDKA